MAIWCFCSTEIAYRLFSQMKITGSLCTPAKFRPSCHAPALVAPSPNQHAVTASSPRYRAAQANPAAWGICVAIGEECEMMFNRRDPQCDGICRPPDVGSSALANKPRKISYGVIPATSTTARSR